MNSGAKYRLLFLAPFPPPVHGSSVVSRQIVESVVVNSAFQIDTVNISTSRSMKEIGKWSFFKPFRYAVALVRALTLLLAHRYDLCYCALTCHGKPFLKDAPFVLLCKLFRRKVVLHQHNKGMSQDVDKKLFNILFHKVYDDSKVILLSWRLYPDIERIVPRENVLICPNGISQAADSDYERQDHQPCRLLFLSNLIVEKGVLVLLDALQMLKQRGLDFICEFVGNETAELDAARFSREVDSRNLKGNAIFLGSKYGDEKAQCFIDSDIFAFPSFYENECFSLVILEAMQYRLPVISTEVGGIPDIVENGENGFAVRPEDAVQLADALAQLIENKKLRIKMGNSGYERYVQKYTSGIFERTICDELLSLVE